MPAVVAWLLAGLGWALTSWIGQMLVTFGISFVVYEFVLEDWLAYLTAQTGALPAFVLQMMGFFGLDVAITIVLSSYALRFASGRIAGVSRRASATVALGS